LDEVFDLAVEVGGGELDFDGHGIEAVEFDEVIAAEFGSGHEDALDLLGIDIDATNDQHVV